MNTLHSADVVAVARANGFPAVAAQPVPTARFNAVYIVSLEQPADYQIIARIAPPAEVGLLFYEQRMMFKEPALHELVATHTTVPVATIHVIDETSRLIDRPVMLMERLPGQPLTRYRTHDAEALRARAHFEVGRALRAVHDACTGREYGYSGPHACMLPQHTWIDAFSIMWTRLLRDVADCGVYTGDDLDLAYAAFRAAADDLEYDGPARLLHMDIWDQNVLVDNSGRLTGLLDWDRALWGDPRLEFALLQMRGYDSEAFFQGYNARRPTGSNDEVRDYQPRPAAALYQLYEVQKYLVIWTRRGGGSNQIRATRDECLRRLAAISHGGL